MGEEDGCWPMTQKKRWECWTLGYEDLQEAARKLEIDLSRLDQEDLNEVARRFTSGLEFVLEDWLEILKEALELVWEEKADSGGVEENKSLSKASGL